MSHSYTYVDQRTQEGQCRYVLQKPESSTSEFQLLSKMSKGPCESAPNLTPRANEINNLYSTGCFFSVSFLEKGAMTTQRASSPFPRGDPSSLIEQLESYRAGHSELSNAKGEFFADQDIVLTVRFRGEGRENPSPACQYAATRVSQMLTQLSQGVQNKPSL